MTYVFFALAAAMVVLTLALLLVPMLRSGRRSGRPRGVFALALAVAFVVPVAAVALYAHVGNLAGLKPQAAKPPQMSIPEAVARIKQRLAKHPQDLQGWVILGRTYTLMDKPAKARDAFGKALALDSDNANLMVAWAEADSMARDDHQINGRSRQLLQKAVKIDAHNQRGLWLLGISDYQQGDFVNAALTWRRLDTLLEGGSKVKAAVQHQIAMADLRADGKSQAQAETMVAKQDANDAPAGSNAASKAQLDVHVSVSPALKAKLDPKATVFVFARNPSGAPMPLAVAKLKASALPATVKLTDGMGMTPSMQLSSASTVVVTARVSNSGQALPQKGDLEGSTQDVSTDGEQQVKVLIDHVNPGS
ncbi:hypothetical protein [Oleiagrimonas sp. C23AA]|uniref:tetratricopeptide repeat protein n=1 Tax=Oleiagrimonas sp. C23AA TaxID=2719047 RepID=UPI0014233E0A|nr:hypothetical protein [Oleiagrimonas sp. C23AA]NII09442.1 hypothetical protein [Oleiagrimonas sp. C23AA]